MAKVFVFGVDGAMPEYVFGKWKNDLPNISKMLDSGKKGLLQTSVPPSSIVAWTSMLSGKDPSHFDVYTYTYKDSENKIQISNSDCVKDKRIWEYLDPAGKKSVLVSVPLTYPVRPLNGAMIGGFLTPSFNEKSVYPESLRSEIRDLIGHDYMFDVNVGLAGYKSLETDAMIEGVYKMTEDQCKVVKNLLAKKDWDFFINVMLGSDRLQHTMWRFMDPSHRRYPGSSAYENVIFEYYKYLDRQLGEMMALCDEDTYFMFVSDHGFDKMDARFNLNDWLIREGYLVMKFGVDLSSATKLKLDLVDWSKTRAYALGAYFGRLYFNKKSRDASNGILSDSEAFALQDEIIGKLEGLKNDRGEEMENKFFKPQEIYDGKYVASGPDLYVFFDNLRFGVNNDIGNSGSFSERTLKGSDDAGHSPLGCFLISHPSLNSEDLGVVDITDVLPTILSVLDVEIPLELKGKVLV